MLFFHNLEHLLPSITVVYLSVHKSTQVEYRIICTLDATILHVFLSLIKTAPPSSILLQKKEAIVRITDGRWFVPDD